MSQESSDAATSAWKGAWIAHALPAARRCAPGEHPAYRLVPGKKTLSGNAVCQMTLFARWVAPLDVVAQLSCAEGAQQRCTPCSFWPGQVLAWRNCLQQGTGSACAGVHEPGVICPGMAKLFRCQWQFICRH